MNSIQPWMLVISVLGLMFTVIATATSVSARIINRISEARIETRDQIVAVNNTLLATINMKENQIYDDLRLIERELHAFQVQSTGPNGFVSKHTFETVMGEQSAGRKEMRAELIGRLDRIDAKLDRPDRL